MEIITVWLAKMWAKFSGAILTAGTVLAAIAGIFLFGRVKGKAAADADHAEKDAKRVETETKEVEKIDYAHDKSREEVEKDIEKIPSPTADPNEPVRIADAPADSAAGKLKGW